MSHASRPLEDQPNQIVDSHLRRRTIPEKIGGKQRTLRVLSVLRPAIDHRRLARALLNHAFDEFDGKLDGRVEEAAESKALRLIDEYLFDDELVLVIPAGCLGSHLNTQTMQGTKHRTVRYLVFIS